MATLLIYLSDDFDGGETAFPRLGVDAKPPIGSAVVFYSYGPGWQGRRCHRDTMHRSNPVRRGTKVVLQRWYSYLEHPFLGARAMPDLSVHGPSTQRLPFQAMVSCDYVDGAEVNVSCRWYNSDACGMGYCPEAQSEAGP